MTEEYLEESVDAEAGEVVETKKEKVENSIKDENVRGRISLSDPDPLDSLDYDISDDEEKRGFKNERTKKEENIHSNG